LQEPPKFTQIGIFGFENMPSGNPASGTLCKHNIQKSRIFLGQFSSKNLLHRSGVDVMITIFCDFRQFLAKKLAFFSKTNVMIKILHNLALF
jgi:hypothetical protein